MRLDFNVLWVDDQPNAVNAQITRITTLMAGEGFSFNPTQCRTIDEVEALIAGDVFQDEVDLILVDWDLGGGVHGQDVIERIRQVAQYKDVVFYSAQTPAADLRRLAFDKGLEGIYCASREGLVDEVVGVFESLVKKVLDLDHTRGIVMGATSDIDHMIHSCLLHIEAKLDDAGKKVLVEQAIKRVQERVKDIAKQGEKLGAATNVTTIIDKFTATNYSAGAVTLSVNLVTSAGSAGDLNLVVKTKSLAAGETYTFPEIVGQVLAPSGFISTIASAATSISIRASGREIT